MEGNRRRPLWKKSCRAVAKNVSEIVLCLNASKADAFFSPFCHKQSEIYTPPSYPTYPPFFPHARHGKTVFGLMCNPGWKTESSDDGMSLAVSGRKKVICWAEMTRR